LPGHPAVAVTTLAINGQIDLITCDIVMQDVEDEILERCQKTNNCSIIDLWNSFQKEIRIKVETDPPEHLVLETYHKFMPVMRLSLNDSNRTRARCMSILIKAPASSCFSHCRNELTISVPTLLGITSTNFMQRSMERQFHSHASKRIASIVEYHPFPDMDTLSKFRLQDVPQQLSQ
jgi:hypothetical protein